MNQFQIEIIVVGCLVAISCSLVGVFLVLKRMSMMSDALTHTILLGIVIGYFITKDLSSPLLMVGAIIVGLLTVYLIEFLKDTRLLSEDSAIGIVFPAFFSIAIILISLNAQKVHLDTDAVLLGELAFVPLDRIIIGSLSIPKAFISSIIILLINLIVITIFYKELKITSFDVLLASTLGFSPIILNYLLMTLVSITAVSAFNVAGSILVIAFMIGPANSAYLLTNKLNKMIIYSIFISVFNVIIGYFIARKFDVSIAGSIAVMIGLTFTFCFLFSKNQGYIKQSLIRNRLKVEFQQDILLHVIKNHPSITYNDLKSLVKMEPKKISEILCQLEEKSLTYTSDNKIQLTSIGQQYLLKKTIV